MLKAPPVNPRVYIYRYYNIEPKEVLQYVLKYVQKSSKIRKKVDNGICPRKEGQQRCYMPDKCSELVSLSPLCCKPRILEHLTDVVIMCTTFTL